MQSTFSRGMRQRLGLARTLLHDPDLVLLDEPYTGLDPHAAAVLRTVLETLRDGLRTVILVTHNLTQGLELADRVAIQVRGRFAWEGRSTDVRARDFEVFYRETVDRVEGRRLKLYLTQLWAVAWKDLLIELRSRERVGAMGGFTVLVGVLFNYAIDPTLVRPEDIASGLIWLTIVFAGTLGLGRTFELEAQDGAFQGVLMSPVPRDALFLGKVLSQLRYSLGRSVHRAGCLRVVLLPRLGEQSGRPGGGTRARRSRVCRGRHAVQCGLVRDRHGRDPAPHPPLPTLGAGGYLRDERDGSGARRPTIRGGGGATPASWGPSLLSL